MKSNRALFVLAAPLQYLIKTTPNYTAFENASTNFVDDYTFSEHDPIEFDSRFAGNIYNEVAILSNVVISLRVDATFNNSKRNITQDIDAKAAFVYRPIITDWIVLDRSDFISKNRETEIGRRRVK